MTGGSIAGGATTTGGAIATGGFGRFTHYRDTDDDPTVEQIERMEKKISSDNGYKCTVISVSRVGNSEQVQP